MIEVLLTFSAPVAVATRSSAGGAWRFWAQMRACASSRCSGACTGNGFGAIIDATEDHFAGGSLVDGSDQDIDGAIDEAASAIDHDHGAVVEIGHALCGFLAFPEDKDAHRFAGENGWLEGVGKFIDIENGEALHARDFVQIEIVGNNFGVKTARDIDKFLIDGNNSRDVFFQDAHFEARHFLHALQDFQATTAALALERVGGIGDKLQFVENETWNAESAIEKMSFADVGDTTVDEYAGVEKFQRRIGRNQGFCACRDWNSGKRKATA